jgi:protein DPCD
VYSLEVDHQKQEIVVRTSNKKYFKRFDIPDLKRLGIKLDESCVAWKYQHNTLIIGYDKPDKILELDRKKQEEIAQLSK